MRRGLCDERQERLDQAADRAELAECKRALVELVRAIIENANNCRSIGLSLRVVEAITDAERLLSEDECPRADLSTRTNVATSDF